MRFSLAVAAAAALAPVLYVSAQTNHLILVGQGGVRFYFGITENFAQTYPSVDLHPSKVSLSNEKQFTGLKKLYSITAAEGDTVSFQL